jgi:uncharacterized membrane protein SpoIIM required for sporulation
MDSQRQHFMSARQQRWNELESLLKRARRGRIARLSGDEIVRLGRLYRMSASDLALALRYFPQDRMTVYLNALVRRAHPIVYQSPLGSRRQIFDFWRYGFPAAYRRIGAYTFAAFAITLVSAAVAAGAVLYQSTNADLLLGPGEADSLRQIMSGHHLWMGANTANHSVAANFIMLNNIQVAFLAFVGGIVFGLGTVYILAMNGISLGAIAAMVAEFGLSRQFWSFVVPHGVIELSVIFTAGGAGLFLGDALLRPGLKTRAQALTAAAHASVLVIFGCIPLLVVAGTIEGFFSASNTPAWLKLSVGIGSGVVLYAYLLLSAPPARRDHESGQRRL